MRDDDTRLPYIGHELVSSMYSNQVAPGGLNVEAPPWTTSSSSTSAFGERAEDPVELEGLRPECDEDHVVSKTLPWKCADGSRSCSSGHWT